MVDAATEPPSGRSVWSRTTGANPVVAQGIRAVEWLSTEPGVGDAVEEKCPDCQRSLCHKKRRVERPVDARCGKVKLRRTHGWCPDCEPWAFPADRALGLRSDSTASPLRQERSALLISKRPAEQAQGHGLARDRTSPEPQHPGSPSPLSRRGRHRHAPEIDHRARRGTSPAQAPGRRPTAPTLYLGHPDPRVAVSRI